MTSSPIKVRDTARLENRIIHHQGDRGSPLPDAGRFQNVNLPVIQVVPSIIRIAIRCLDMLQSAIMGPVLQQLIFRT